MIAEGDVVLDEKKPIRIVLQFVDGHAPNKGHMTSARMWKLLERSESNIVLRLALCIASIGADVCTSKSRGVGVIILPKSVGLSA
jgi:hypothetical protein